MRYEELTLLLAGEETDVLGTLNLTTGEIQLDAKVPLRALGTQFGCQSGYCHGRRGLHALDAF